MIILLHFAKSFAINISLKSIVSTGIDFTHINIADISLKINK